MAVTESAVAVVTVAAIAVEKPAIAVSALAAFDALIYCPTNATDSVETNTHKHLSSYFHFPHLLVFSLSLLP